MKVLEEKFAGHVSLFDSLVAENGTVRAENVSLKADMELLKQNYRALARRITEIESSNAARAQEDAIRAQSDEDRDAVIINLKDRSNTLKNSIQAMQTQVDKGATVDMMYSSIAVITRRMDELDHAASATGRALPGSGPVQSGGQSSAAIITRMCEQIAYIGKWVHQLCKMLWDIQRFTRRRSLHVVSSSPSFLDFSPIYHWIFSSFLFRFQSGRSVIQDGSAVNQILETLGSLAAVNLGSQIQDTHMSGRDKLAIQVSFLCSFAFFFFLFFPFSPFSLFSFLL